MMDRNLWQHLYLNQPEHYDWLVQSENYQGYLSAALRQICSLEHKTVVEFGQVPDVSPCN